MHSDPRDDAFGNPVDTLDGRPAPTYRAFASWMEEFVFCEYGDPAPPDMMLSYAPWYLLRYLYSRGD